MKLNATLQSIATFLAISAGTVVSAADVPATPPAPSAAEPKPVLLKPDDAQFTLVKNWTFGNKRPDATVRNKADLDQDFYYRYIWENGKLDKFKTYWSYHRDYPEGDAKSLHVFDDNALTLKGRIPPGGGLHERGIESGMLRGKIPVTPGMYIEMRAKLTGGVGVWPNFWLEEGVQYPDGTFSPPPKALPEIDIFEFFNWDGRPQTRIMTCNVQTFGGGAAYGNPHDIFTTLANAGYERHLDVGFDCSKDFHVFALDWIENKPIWLLDGKPIKQTYYEWHGPPAHVVVANSIGMNLSGVKQTEMVADEKQWDYAIDYIRIWNHKAPPGDNASASKSPSGNDAVSGANEKNASVVVLDAFENTGGRKTVTATGKWESPVLCDSTAAAAKLKANPVLKVDVTVPPDAADAGWFQIKLAINGPGIERTESPKWLLERHPGKAGIDKVTLVWDTSDVAAKLPDNPNWFKIELVTQGDHPRTIYASNLRAEPASGTANAAKPNAPAPAPAAASGPSPFPDDKDFPGKGPIRKFGFMIGERKAFWDRREKDQGAIVFVGDSLTGGWKNLAKDFPKLKVANRGVGGDTSRGALFRFKEDALDLNPKALIIEIGNNDLTAMGTPADMLSNLTDMVAQAEKQNPEMPIVLCTIPPSANPKAPVKAADRQAMNEGIHKLAMEKKNRRYCDLYPALANADGSPKPEYFTPDLLHPNDAGHVKWAEILTPIFEEMKLE